MKSNNNSRKMSTFGWISVILGGFAGSAIAAFLKDKMISMPVNFPLDKLWWDIFGVLLILLSYLFISYIISVIIKKSKKSKKTTT